MGAYSPIVAAMVVTSLSLKKGGWSTSEGVTGPGVEEVEELRDRFEGGRGRDARSIGDASMRSSWSRSFNNKLLTSALELSLVKAHARTLSDHPMCQPD